MFLFCQIVTFIFENSLKRNIRNVFSEIYDLQRIVENGLAGLLDIETILKYVKEKFLSSSETSQYYKEQALKIESFLLDNMHLNVADECLYLKFQFYDTIKIPTMRFENYILSVIHTKEGVQIQILNGSAQKVLNTQILLELCGLIRQKITTQQVSEILEKASDKELYLGLILPINTMDEKTIIKDSTIQNLESAIQIYNEEIQKLEAEKIDWTYFQNFQASHKGASWKTTINDALKLLEDLKFREMDVDSITERIEKIREEALKTKFYKRDSEQIRKQVIEQLEATWFECNYSFHRNMEEKRTEAVQKFNDIMIPNVITEENIFYMQDKKDRFTQLLNSRLVRKLS